MRLIREKNQYLADVRDNPWSMKFGFTKNNLALLCEKIGIQYISIPSLGIPSKLRDKLNSKEDYKEVFKIYVSVLMNEIRALPL